MNAAVMYGPGDVRFEDVPRPACPEGGFVLKVEAVGLCGSDIRNLTTDSRSGQYPFIYGHEVVGRVVETDTTEELYQVGRLLYVYPEAAWWCHSVEATLPVGGGLIGGVCGWRGWGC
ncbi:hypothetical protein EFN19_01720, partial [Propionibacterium freudenreichii]|nr:hypothetical protein [Propionibacterium freudenreichii]